jgi:hypothetical protein
MITIRIEVPPGVPVADVQREVAEALERAGREERHIAAYSQNERREKLGRALIDAGQQVES